MFIPFFITFAEVTLKFNIMKKKQNLNEIKNNKDKKTEDRLEGFYELFDSEKISFYDFNPEEETFSEACEKIRKKEKRKLN